MTKGTYIFDEQKGEFIHVDTRQPEQVLCKCGCGKMIDVIAKKDDLHTGQYL